MICGSSFFGKKLSSIKKIEIDSHQTKHQLNFIIFYHPKNLLQTLSLTLSLLQTFIPLPNSHFPHHHNTNHPMINIIRQDGSLNQKLRQFPNATASIAIFGTQSTGKSTLMNNAFGASFPVLNTKQDRKRCTKGVWFQHVADFNIIDTEGFDSAQRKAQEKILEKQIALFCLAMADVVVINMWMNQIGRYQGSHTHILKSIIKVSQRLISSQTKTVIFVVKDCTEDADRRVLRQQLQFRVNQIMHQADSSGKPLKLNIDYFFMSHYFYKKQAYLKQARELKSMIRVRKSHLSNYSPEDRIIYIRDLWQKITSAQNKIDLRSIQDALRGYALQRVKQQSIEYSFELIRQVMDLSRHKSYERFAQYIRRQAQSRFLQLKPAHISQKQVASYITQLKQILDYTIAKQFTTVILPTQQDYLLQQLQKCFTQNQLSRQLQKITIRKRKQTTDVYKKIISGYRESLSLIRKFTQRINQIVVKYERQISHLFNMFETRLQKQLNDQLDRQLARKQVYFDGKQIDQKIKQVCTQFQYNEWQINFKDMWQKISHRAINQKLPQRIEQLSRAFVEDGSVWTGDRTTNILAFHRKLQKQCEQFCRNLLNYFEQQDVVYQPFDKVKDQIMGLMERALIREVLIFFNKFVEDAIPCDFIDCGSVYVVLLWRVCVLFGHAANEEEKAQILGQLVFVFVVADCRYRCLQQEGTDQEVFGGSVKLRKREKVKLGWMSFVMHILMRMNSLMSDDKQCFFCNNNG